MRHEGLINVYSFASLMRVYNMWLPEKGDSILGKRRATECRLGSRLVSVQCLATFGGGTRGTARIVSGTGKKKRLVSLLCSDEALFPCPSLPDALPLTLRQPTQVAVEVHLWGISEAGLALGKGEYWQWNAVGETQTGMISPPSTRDAQ